MFTVGLLRLKPIDEFLPGIGIQRVGVIQEDLKELKFWAENFKLSLFLLRFFKIQQIEDLHSGCIFIQ